MRTSATVSQVLGEELFQLAKKGRGEIHLRFESSGKFMYASSLVTRTHV
jgi:hypothetical protein